MCTLYLCSLHCSFHLILSIWKLNYFRLRNQSKGNTSFSVTLNLHLALKSERKVKTDRLISDVQPQTNLSSIFKSYYSD